MATIFTRIVEGSLPCYKVAESADFLAFLDTRPLTRGHTLVIPKKETDYFFDLEDEALSALMVFAKQVAKALKATVPCRKIGVSVVGLEVAHAHVHLIPIDAVADMSFAKARVDLSPEEMSALAAAIGERVGR